MGFAIRSLILFLFQLHTTMPIPSNVPVASDALARECARLAESAVAASGVLLQTWSNIATIVAALAALLAIGFGFYQFRRTLALQRGAYADELYMKVAESISALDKKDTVPNRADADFWRHSAILAGTESIFRLTRGDRYWEATVKMLLKQQKAFIDSSDIDKSTFNPDFVALMDAAAESQ